ncbi:hypothetical protein PI125_g7570 [Phytophthora idaei]|nr:hypothetical protein PI125_g7570 [Phytophthora idaei]KAG3144307.1 hypothetical protein PI126_g14248 [Phytophthora idaei]
MSGDGKESQSLVSMLANTWMSTDEDEARCYASPTHAGTDKPSAVSQARPTSGNAAVSRHIVPQRVRLEILRASAPQSIEGILRESPQQHRGPTIAGAPAAFNVIVQGVETPHLREVRR